MAQDQARGTRMTPRDDALPVAALALAAQAHYGQRRKQSGDEFIEHPVAVAEIVMTKTIEPQTVAAAYLHDVLEKTDVNASQLRQQFGDLVADVVIACTEDPAISCYADRKRDLRRKAISAGRPASIIYAADRVANLRDWTNLEGDARHEVSTALGTNFEERLSLWQEDLEDLSRADPDLPFLAEIEIELGHLHNHSSRAA